MPATKIDWIKIKNSFQDSLYHQDALCKLEDSWAMVLIVDKDSLDCDGHLAAEWKSVASLAIEIDDACCGAIAQISQNLSEALADISQLQNQFNNLSNEVSNLQWDSHVPATVSGDSYIWVTTGWVNNQTFWLSFNINQLPSTDANNQLGIGTDGKLFVQESGGWWSLDCDWVADCITNNVNVQNALQSFIENTNFTLEGEWTFNDNVAFNDQVDFNNWPVNFNDLTINNTDVSVNYDSDSVINNNGNTINNTNTTENYENSTINLDENSTFVNEGDTVLNGDTNIENLTVENITITGSGSIACAEVENCIRNNPGTQDAIQDLIGGQIIANVTIDNAQQTYNGTDTERQLPSTPLSKYGVHITTDSGTNLRPDIDYDVVGDEIQWLINPNNEKVLQARWLVWQANTVPGGKARTDKFTATAGQTVFQLSDVPAGKDWIFVSNRSSLFAKEWVGLDYEYDAVNNTVTLDPQTEDDVIHIRCIGFLAMPTQTIAMAKNQFTWSGSANTFVINDAQCTEDSMVDVYPKTQPAGDITAVATAGQFTVTTTAADEDGIVFNYKIAY